MKKVDWEENYAKILSENRRKLFKTKIKIIHYQNGRLLEYINQNYLYKRRMRRMRQIFLTKIKWGF